MTIKRLVLVVIISMFGFSAAFIGIAYLLYQNQQTLINSHESRYQSYLLANELRQSSDDLTRFARTYAITGEEKYKNYYFEVLAIRNGSQARPQDYERMYWDLVINSHRDSSLQGRVEALSSRMRKAGFTEAEFNLLHRAERYSNILAEHEMNVIDLMHSQAMESQPRLPAKLDANSQLQQQLFDDEYHMQKSKIMQPVADFLKLLNGRTSSWVDTYTNHSLVLLEVLVLVVTCLSAFSLLLAWGLVRLVLKPLGGEPAVMHDIAQSIARGNLHIDFNDQQNEGVYHSLKMMTQSLIKLRIEEENLQWIQQGEVLTGEVLRSVQSLENISNNLLTHLCQYLSAKVGVLYSVQASTSQEDKTLQLKASFASETLDLLKQEYQLGEGRIGKVAIDDELCVIRSDSYHDLAIKSALGGADPAAIVILPFSYQGKVLGVIGLVFMHEFGRRQEIFLNKIKPIIGVSYANICAKSELADTLQEAQELSEVLKIQQEKLRVINESLLDRTRSLEASQIELKSQAIQLTETNKYKSQFLANMSHELRTPLNSSIILSKILAENTAGNLQKEQVEFVKIIHENGMSLLELINNVLDISKLESGFFELHYEYIILAEFIGKIESRFLYMAQAKGISFSVQMAKNLPDHLFTDSMRLEQILNNLIANAIKFTNRGEVSLIVDCACDESVAQPLIEFIISDTGIGLNKEQLEVIFEPFRQADDTTTRQFGGTGLGLAISQQLANLLNASLMVESEQGLGSQFILKLPISDNGQQIITSSAIVSSDENKLEIKHFKFSEFSLNRRKRFNNSVRSILLLCSATQQGLLKDNIDMINLIKVYSQKGLLSSLSYINSPIVIVDCSIYESGLDFLLFKLTNKKLNTPDIILYANKALPEKIISKYNKNIKDIVFESNGSMQHLQASVNCLIKNTQVGSEKTISELTQYEQLKDRNILLVSNDVQNAFAYAKQLSIYAINVHIASSGEQALHLLAKYPNIELVLTDTVLPEMDGYEIVAAIRAHNETAHLPVIVVTASVLPGDREKCLSAGCNDYLTKPISLEGLLVTLNKWL